MKRKKHFLFIFAIAMMPMIAGSLSSCNADDDYDNEVGGTYTLAKRQMGLTPENENRDFYNAGTVSCNESLLEATSLRNVVLQGTFTWQKAYSDALHPIFIIECVQNDVYDANGHKLYDIYRIVNAASGDVTLTNEHLTVSPDVYYINHVYNNNGSFVRDDTLHKRLSYDVDISGYKTSGLW